MGDAEGQVHSLLADALTQAPQTQPKEGSASAGQSAESRRGAARDRSIFLWLTLTHALCYEALHFKHPPSAGNQLVLKITIDWWLVCNLGNAGRRISFLKALEKLGKMKR